MKKLVLIDSDETLRHTDGLISDRTKHLIRENINLGNYVYICTARPRYHAVKIAMMAEAGDIIISSNGAEIYDIKNNQLINCISMDIKSCKKLIQYAHKNDIRLILVVDDYEYVTKEIKSDRQKLLLTEKEIDNLEIKQCMFTDKDSQKLMSAKKFVLSLKDVIIINESDNSLDWEEYWFSIAGINASKGNALKFLRTYLKIDKEDTVAIGNDYNDVSMFKEAGISVAVANTPDEIKKIVSVVVSSNNEDGVAEFLERLYREE
jgi:Cof subfamily protein (haloacid dehalogenase superfamily)